MTPKRPENGSQGLVEVPSELLMPDTVAVLQAFGDCMEPTFHDGDWLQLSRPPMALNEFDGLPVLVELPGGERIVQRLHVLFASDGTPNYWIEPDNEEYEPLRLPRTARIVGRVARIWQDA